MGYHNKVTIVYAKRAEEVALKLLSEKLPRTPGALMAVYYLAFA